MTYVSHPWTDCDYLGEVACLERAVFGVQQVEAVTGRFVGEEFQACVVHVGELLVADGPTGRWKVMSL